MGFCIIAMCQSVSNCIAARYIAIIVVLFPFSFSVSVKNFYLNSLVLFHFQFFLSSHLGRVSKQLYGIELPVNSKALRLLRVDRTTAVIHYITFTRFVTCPLVESVNNIRSV